MPPLLEIRLFGTVELRSEGLTLAPLPSARAQSLLGYLLVHRGAAVPRERLAAELWPESTEAQARTNLRHVLHPLRRSLPHADERLEITGSALRWREESPFLGRSGGVRGTARVRSGRPAGRVDRRCKVGLLQRALKLVAVAPPSAARDAQELELRTALPAPLVSERQNDMPHRRSPACNSAPRR